MRRRVVPDENDGDGPGVAYGDDGGKWAAWFPGPDWVVLFGAEAERLLAALTALMAERMDMQTMTRGRGRGGRDGD